MGYVLRFDEACDAEDAAAVVGAKGEGLRAIASLGIPVPPGLTLTTAAFHRFEQDGALADDVWNEVASALAHVESATGRKLGDASAPLLVSVRSGAPVTMPGMLDTVLNLGLNATTAEAIARETGDRRFALDSHRRFLQMYGSVVLGVPRGEIEAPLARAKLALGRPRMADGELGADSLLEILESLEGIIATRAGMRVPEEPEAQLRAAIAAVFRSWHGARAVRYRAMQNIPHGLGTACTIQAMVFGNRGASSGSGVAFTRDPSTGERRIHGEFLANAQGEDVVSGIRTPASLTVAASAPGREEESLERVLPGAYLELVRHAETLERHLGDVQDVEFTVEQGRVYVLQTRAAKRSPRAAVRIAVDLVTEGRIDVERALESIEAPALAHLVRARLPDDASLATRGIVAIAQGLPASGGAATGIVVLDPEEAVRRAAEGVDVILVRRDTSPEDVHAMRDAVGVLTAAGGMTSHAAVVARGLGKPCVVGASALQVDYQAASVGIRAKSGAQEALAAGETITIDGGTGRVFRGSVEAIAETAVPELDSVMTWADAHRRLGVRAMVDSVSRAASAIAAGAEGIGLFSTDSLVLAGDALDAFRRLLLDEPARAERHGRALEDALLPELVALLGIAPGKPMVVRLFDDVLRRALPTSGELAALATRTHLAERELARRVRSLTERRPGLGFRGVRLGLAVPELYRAEARALARAVVHVTRETGVMPRLELAIPAVSTGREFGVALALLRDALAHRDLVDRDLGEIAIGAVVGVPHACLDAAEIATLSEFLVFDTLELTQAVFVMGREDAKLYLPRYLHELRIFDEDPFVRFDETGVGRLIRTGAEQARVAHPGIRLEVAGEVAGEVAACQLAEDFGMNSVSCPTNRLAVARLSAAQAHIRAEKRSPRARSESTRTPSRA